MSAVVIAVRILESSRSMSVWVVGREGVGRSVSQDIS